MGQKKEQKQPEEKRPKRITKIKCKKGLWFFAWEIYQASTNNWDEHTLSCKDQPRPELIERFTKMGEHVAAICEINAADGTIMASGITLSHTDSGNRYLVITAQKKLEYSKSPLIINTPARPETPENEYESEDFCWGEELFNDVNELEKEAWKYITGDRAQQNLDFGEAKQDGKEPEKGADEKLDAKPKKKRTAGGGSSVSYGGNVGEQIYPMAAAPMN